MPRSDPNETMTPTEVPDAAAMSRALVVPLAVAVGAAVATSTTSNRC
jgi:hypothetical protein